MCIQGTDSLGKFGIGMVVVAGVMGAALMGAGLLTGGLHDWPTYAFGLIVSGGIIMMAGFGGGLTIAIRADIIDAQDREGVEKVKQASYGKL